MSSGTFFWAKTSLAIFLSFENCRTVENTAMEAIKAHVIDAKITWVSNYKKFKSDSCNWTPIWSPTDYVANRYAKNQSWSKIFGIDTIMLFIENNCVSN